MVARSKGPKKCNYSTYYESCYGHHQLSISGSYVVGRTKRGEQTVSYLDVGCTYISSSFLSWGALWSYGRSRHSNWRDYSIRFVIGIVRCLFCNFRDCRNRRNHRCARLRRRCGLVCLVQHAIEGIRFFDAMSCRSIIIFHFTRSYHTYDVRRETGGRRRRVGVISPGVLSSSVVSKEYPLVMWGNQFWIFVSTTFIILLFLSLFFRP